MELQARLSARLAAFTELLREGGDFCEVTVEEQQADLLIKLLNKTVGMLENTEDPADFDGHRTTSVFIASVHPRCQTLTWQYVRSLELEITQPHLMNLQCDPLRA